MKKEAVCTERRKSKKNGKGDGRKWYRGKTERQEAMSWGANGKD